jgi:hypothetical protein
MHYPNCAYSIHEFTCNSATPDLQTIVPRACHLDVVGGNTITELDREGIRNAYVPGLQALLATGNRPQSWCVSRLFNIQRLGVHQ